MDFNHDSKVFKYIISELILTSLVYMLDLEMPMIDTAINMYMYIDRQFSLISDRKV